ncbi:IS1595 family transposase [Ferruginibacter sp. SUN106]|uniref:IS1595 family transposase n=1 Tax=Ferruginibacter sp. SUN106 TaxID=2978348 RepID=UPI003D35BBAC
MFKNLRELITSMPDETTCRNYLIKERWDGVIVCPYCSCERVTVIEGGKRFKCNHKDCRKNFSVQVGTIMEASKIPLCKWLTAIYLVTAHKKGISSYQLGRDLGISQKTSWFMLHRIREMLRIKDNVKLDNIVEVDEVYIGGKVRNMSKTKRAKLREEGNTYNTKTMVMGLLERGGNLKLITIGNSNNSMAIQPTVKDNVNTDAVVITDSLGSYTGLNKSFAAHEIVNHSEQEYVREGNIHTNSIEGAFSLLKRSIIGIYHQVTPKHLSRYCDETMFRYNLRKMKDADRFTFSLNYMTGRLTYKDLIQEGKKAEKTEYVPLNTPLNIRGKKQSVVQIKDGEVIATYKSIAAAAKINGLSPKNIRRVLLGVQVTCGGCHWNYA